MVDSHAMEGKILPSKFRKGIVMAKMAFGYIRVSGQGQVEGDGLIRQEKSIKDYAKANGISIKKIFRDEGISGTLEERPALRNLLDLKKNGHDIKTVVIERMDRLARDLMVQEAIISDLQKKGFNLISVVEGPDLLSEDPTRKLIRQFLGAIAEYDKSMVVSKLRAARERKRASGEKCEGRKNYREARPDVLKAIRRLRRKPRGAGMKRRSYAQVAVSLNEQGIRTMTGKKWTGANVAVVVHRS
ncbi:resolvase, N-terminal domain protein [delta proteobacterium NaphS2]|nr:resolvase, N-terminal domain protein [delta proteobacterium NaphS2]